MQRIQDQESRESQKEDNQTLLAELVTKKEATGAQEDESKPSEGCTQVQGDYIIAYPGRKNEFGTAKDNHQESDCRCLRMKCCVAGCALVKWPSVKKSLLWHRAVVVGVNQVKQHMQVCTAGSP
ncbi:hypothetical protein GDO81_004547 [Engystomops pustulosus]|uniref:Uncharacterized protein n=1 Tax=Engystomops pustulosus TaxID=76066 RepID=A0AAV6ZVG2_ENGPU|nr:hypothetical protein GDO81_004547 [Engystomops pustulosus]